jgi:hypothetical protein
LKKIHSQRTVKASALLTDSLTGLIDIMSLENNVEVPRTQGTASPDSSLYDSIMEGPPAGPAQTEVAPPAAVPSAIEVGENTTGKVDEQPAPAAAPPEGTVPVAPGAPAQPDTSGQPQEIVPPGVPAPAEGVEDRGNCDFRPDFKYETEQGRQWKAVSDQRRGLGVEVNENGRYKVEYGDSLSAIAERNLRGSGLAHDRKAIEAEVAQIVSLNSNRYPSLSCNNHFIKTGWTLTIPRHQPGEVPAEPRPPAPTQPRPEAPVPAEPPRPAPPRVEVLPPEQRRPTHTHGRDGVYIHQADTVNIYQGRQDAPPPVVRRQPVAPPYYEGTPEYIPQHRQPPVVIIERGDDWGYSRPPYRPQLPPYVNDGCFGDYNRPGQYDRFDRFDRFDRHNRYDRFDRYDRNCRNGRFAIDLMMNQGRRHPGRMPIMNDFSYGQFNNWGNRRGNNFSLSLRF